MNEIQFVELDRLNAILDSKTNGKREYEPYGLFITEYDDGLYIACDNSTGDAWTEEFLRQEDAVAWLNGKFEVGDEHVACANSV